MKEISIKDIKNIRIGQAEDEIGGTGCTVFVCDEGMPAGLDVRGGGPASRESELLKSLANADRIHALVLGGGSAFGLDAAGGVMQCLVEKDIGFDVGVTKVPLVCQSDLFDLTVADSKAHPDKEMGYKACQMAFDDCAVGGGLDGCDGMAGDGRVAGCDGLAGKEPCGGRDFTGNYQDGNHGAGTGATVGKFYGMDYCMKTGIGSYAMQVGDLQIGAVVALNALGDVFDYENGKQIAGLLTEDKRSLRLTTDEMLGSYQIVENKFTGNTTIGTIITNAKFNKTQLCKIAAMAHNGYARSINPVNTSADGDSVYALSVGEIAADMDFVGTFAAKVMGEAIKRAVYSAEGKYGFPSARDL